MAVPASSLMYWHLTVQCNLHCNVDCTLQYGINCKVHNPDTVLFCTKLVTGVQVAG